MNRADDRDASTRAPSGYEVTPPGVIAKPAGGVRPAGSRTGELLPALTVGAVAGIDNIGVGLAIAALLFSGPLSAGLGLGVASVFLAAAILALVVGIGSGLRNAVALVQESAVAVLAATLTSTLAGMSAPPAERVSTAIAIIGASTVVTGLALWLTGAFRLGRFVRLLPYPVVAGFVAASGWLLVDGAVTIMSESSASAGSGSSGGLDALWLAWLPALGFAAALLAALRLANSVYAAPAMLITAIAGFHALLPVTGLDTTAARGLGLLPTIEASSIVLPGGDLIDRIDWSYVVQAWPGMLAVAAISLVGTMLNTGGVELATAREADHDRELRVTGWANVLAGLTGGPSGYTGLGLTVFADRIGANGRAAGIATAAVLLGGLFFADRLVGGIPLFVTSGLVLYLGLELLLSWLVETRGRLPTAEWLVIVLITVVVALTGFVEGLLVGILVSAGVFIYSYSRLPVIRLAASGADRRSAVDRSPAAGRRLAERGDATMILRLQGYLFFATADRIVDLVRQRLNEGESPALRFLVLDFMHVSGIDSAAIASFVKIRNLARRGNVQMLVTHVSAPVREQLSRGGLGSTPHSTFREEPDLDHALEYCEERLLAEPAGAAPGQEEEDPLRTAVGDHPRLADLVAAMEHLELQPGDFLIRAGDMADDVYFVARGWVRVQLTLPDGRTLRLRTMTAGAVVGEIALYLRQRRTADVLCEKPARIYKMTRERLERIEREDSELAALFHRAVAVGLSDKLAIANRAIQASQG